LPAPLLQQGTYELWFYLSDLKTIGGVERKRGIFLEILDDRGSFASFPFRKNALLAIPLQWQIKRCG
jgi:hypothetical protein